MSEKNEKEPNKMTDLTIMGWIVFGIAIGAAFGAVSGEGNLGAGMFTGGAFAVLAVFIRQWNLK